MMHSYSVVQKLGGGQLHVPVRNAALDVRLLLGQLRVLGVQTERRQVLQVAQSLIELL